ncbi:MAG: acylneuraminate cytidylyltransferase [Actinomycetota bacterium]|nr:acylneuraminate cytidylyltransferase [Actinomycetota bacterium]
MGNPSAVAVIPARGGSKGIPAKNLAEVAGRSLVRRAIESCLACAPIASVVVSTDDEGIGREASAAGAGVIRRPAELSGDDASSESAVLHALGELRAGGIEPAVVVFVQATSPFIDPVAMAGAVEQVQRGEADVVFAAAASHEFLWRRDEAGSLSGLNHDPVVRMRRQDRQPDWRETGAFYVMRAAGFEAAGHRFFGRVGVAEVDERDAIEIDTPDQLDLARALAGDRDRVPSPAAPDPLGDIPVRLLVTDFDGVHTNDRALLAEDGSEMVLVNRADGHGVKLLRQAGLPMLILSTETNSVVARRAEKLGVACLHGLDDKWAALRSWLGERAIEPAAVAYVGNDVNDLECLQQVGTPIAVADAHPLVIAASRHVTRAAGGDGAVREVADLLLAALGAVQPDPHQGEPL